MKRQSKRLAMCAMTAALGVVLMLLGTFLGLGIYMAPMFVGWCLIPIGKEYGVRYQIMLWIVISLLCAIFVTDIEQNLMFAFLFGWYPIARTKLQKLQKFPRIFTKLLLFNGIVIALEAVVITLLVPEAMEALMAILLIVLGNITFFLYDRAFPVFEFLSDRYRKKLFH